MTWFSFLGEPAFIPNVFTKANISIKPQYKQHFFHSFLSIWILDSGFTSSCMQ